VVWGIRSVCLDGAFSVSPGAMGRLLGWRRIGDPRLLPALRARGDPGDGLHLFLGCDGSPLLRIVIFPCIAGALPILSCFDAVVRSSTRRVQCGSA